MLVSKLIGCRAKDHLRKLTSCPVTIKSFELRCTARPNQSVFRLRLPNQHEKHRCWNSFNRAAGLGLDIQKFQTLATVAADDFSSQSYFNDFLCCGFAEPGNLTFLSRVNLPARPGSLVDADPAR